MLDVIPANLIDAAFNSGVKGAQPPPPAPIVTPPEPQPHTPEPPKPVVTPPPKPEPLKPSENVEPVKNPEIETPKPKSAKHEVKPDLTVVRRDSKKAADDAAADAEKAAKEAKRARDARAKAIADIAKNLKNNFTTGTTVDMPNDSTAAYANYASIVKSVYTQAWVPPDDTASDDANVKVSVTIANDGRVISAHIVGPSGDASVDRSVQKTLDRVSEIAPFPDGATDKERTYIINFNLKAKRMLG